MVWRLRIPKKILDSHPKSCIYSESEAVWRIRIQKMILDSKNHANTMVWRLRIPKKILDSRPKSCKYRENQVVWRIRIRTVIFPKLHLYRELEAFVNSCLIRGPSIWTLTGLDQYSSAIFAILTFLTAPNLFRQLRQFNLFSFP